MKSEIIGSFDIFENINFIEHFIGKKVPIESYKVFVEVYSNEGKNLPHFHVYTADRAIDAPIRLYTCGYFLHGEHSSPLPNGGAEALDEWLRKSSSKADGMSNWEYADYIWCILYDKSKRFTEVQPDYSKLDMPLENTEIHINIDLGITNKNLFKIDNDSIKLGFDDTDAKPSIVIMGKVKDNSKSIPAILKYIWYHKNTGESINVCIHKNNITKYNTKDIERLVKNIISAELFKINSNVGKYTQLDFYKISNKAGNKRRK